MSLPTLSTTPARRWVDTDDLASNEIYTMTGVSIKTLRYVLWFNIITTTIHYPHNYIKAEQYPTIWPFFPNPTSFRVSIVVLWPLLCMMGFIGYKQYRSGTLQGVRNSIPMLGAYSLLGASSIGHFLGGVPQIPWFFLATIFTDCIAGMVLLGLLWKIKKAVDAEADRQF